MSDIAYSYVALLDVLGYKNHLEEDRNSGRTDFMEAMRKALSVFEGVNEAEFRYNAISDTIIVTCPQRDKFIEYLKILKKVQVAFLSVGLFIRGAAVYAQHFHSGNLTYSPALSTAYQLEQQVAIYPRIIIDTNIIDMHASSGEEKHLLSTGMTAEWNGIYFLNIIDKRNWRKIKNFAKVMYEKDHDKITGNESAFSKHVWFENFVFSSSFSIESESRFIGSW